MNHLRVARAKSVSVILGGLAIALCNPEIVVDFHN
jgi:hypothetical protein